MIGVSCSAPAYIGPGSTILKGKVKDSDTLQVITNIRVSLISGFTNNRVSGIDGVYSFYNHDGNFTLAAEDIDGATNGAYLPTNFTVTLPYDFDGYTTNIDILMKTNG